LQKNELKRKQLDRMNQEDKKKEKRKEKKKQAYKCCIWVRKFWKWIVGVFVLLAALTNVGSFIIDAIGLSKK
jgi:hypothetical protein